MLLRFPCDTAGEYLFRLCPVSTDNPLTLGSEALLLVNSDDPSRADLDRAYALLAEVASKRPGWYRVPLMLGVLNEREGNLELAGQKSREAITLCDRERTGRSRIQAANIAMQIVRRRTM